MGFHGEMHGIFSPSTLAIYHDLSISNRDFMGFNGNLRFIGFG